MEARPAGHGREILTVTSACRERGMRRSRRPVLHCLQLTRVPRTGHTGEKIHQTGKRNAQGGKR